MLHWSSFLSLNEQEELVLARLLLAAPRFALLDRIGAALTPAQVEHVLDTLAKHGVTYLSVEHEDGSLERYNALLELHEGGSWKWIPLTAGQPVQDEVVRRSLA